MSDSPNLTNIKAWHDALVSGNYAQGQGALRRGGEFCCLGVACEVAIDAGVTGIVRNPDEGYTVTGSLGNVFTETDVLPHPVRYWLGLGGGDPHLVMPDDLSDMPDDVPTGATVLNDDYTLPFHQIADCIQATWPEAFPLVGSDDQQG